MKQKKIPSILAILMLSTATMITICGILFKQALWRMLPIYISLVIALLQSRVNRLAPLLGGINSVVYAAVYFSYGLYASGAYTLLVGAPLQIIAFIRWQKHSSGNSTVLRRLPKDVRITLALGFTAAWVLLLILTHKSGSNYYLLDNTVTLLGILATVLMMLSYIEYTPLMVMNSICSLMLYIAMLEKNPEQVTYIIFSSYSLLCNILALLTAQRSFYGCERKAAK